MPSAPWDDDLDDREYPDPEATTDDDCETVSCPECGADVYEDADQCPVCGMFLLRDTRPWAGRSLWWVALAVLGILAVILSLALGL